MAKKPNGHFCPRCHRPLGEKRIAIKQQLGEDLYAAEIGRICTNKKCRTVTMVNRFSKITFDDLMEIS